MTDFTLIDGLPAAVDVEKSILGALLFNSARMADIGGLRPDDFSLDSHRRIFQCMTDLAENEGKFDLVTLSTHMAGVKELQDCGGVAYLADLDGLLSKTGFDIEFQTYISILRDKAISRRIMGLSSSVIDQCASQDQTSLEIASWAISELTRIVESGERKTEVFQPEDMALEAESRLLDNPEDAEVLPTGISQLDEITGGGVRRGELWIIGAAPSRGKTTLARQIAKHTTLRGIGAYVHSGEMSKESWFDVTACLIGEMKAWKVRQPRLMSPKDKDTLRWSLRRLSKLPLFISDAGGITLDRLVWNATRAVKKNAIELFAVDYAQIINAPGRDPREKVTNVAQRLRLFAKDNGVATLLLSQSPRPEGRNINAKPNMFSLKESGALEEAAHVVVLPYRPVGDDGKFTGDDELIIGKNRWGAIGSVNVWLNGEYLRFEER